MVILPDIRNKIKQKDLLSQVPLIKIYQPVPWRMGNLPFPSISPSRLTALSPEAGGQRG
jgi:hypothetical protein